MKVVFDANIFISAIVIPGARSERALLRISEGRDILIISKPVIDEILSILSMKVGRDKEEISRVAVYLTDLATLVYPTRKVRILRAGPDNRIIECAVSGRADAVVTGDKEMLALKEYLGTKIISLREYLET